MPPSINSEILERNPSSDSLHSSPFQTMRKSHDETQQQHIVGTMTSSNKHSSQYRPYGDDSEDEDNGCGDLALLERPSWAESLRRLKWCCPGPTASKKSTSSTQSRRLRSQSESTESSKSSRHLSPTPIAPIYQWEVPPQMMYPPVTPQGWYAPPPPLGYPQSPYQNPYQQAPWGYPGTPVAYAVPPQQNNGMPYPPPPPQMFHNIKQLGYSPSPVVQQRKNTAPEPYQALPQYDSGTESEVSRKSNSRRQGVSTPKQRRISKPPLVQRRATAPVQSSPTPFKESIDPFKESIDPFKESIDQPLMHPPLPRKQPSRNNIFSARPRLPSEMSRTSVGTTGTTSSRHRRQAHETFEFSTNSLREIAREGPIPTGPPPVNFVEVQQEASSLHRQNSWSSWDDQTHHDDDNSLLLSPDEDEVAGYISPVDEEGASPARPKGHPADWMLKWAQQKPATEPPPSPASRTSRVSDPPAVPTKDTANGPVYLPLSLELDKQAQDLGSKVVFSGWVAMSESDAMRNKLRMAEDNEVPIDRQDIYYLQLVQNESKHSLQVYHDGETKVVELSPSLQVQGQEISGRAGRCVLLQDAWTRQVLWTILPVSLPSYFFRRGKLISDRHFSLVQSAMFTPFYNATTGMPQEWCQEYCAMRYAPDEQHDAATHILFCLDAALSSVLGSE